MLRKSERDLILQFNHYCSKFCFVPAEVDLENEELLDGRRLWRRRLSLIQFGMFAVNSLYKNWKLFEACSFHRDSTPLHHLVLLLVMALASSMLSIWFYLQYIKYPEIHITLFNMAVGEAAGPSKIFFSIRRLILSQCPLLI